MGSAPDGDLGSPRWWGGGSARSLSYVCVLMIKKCEILITGLPKCTDLTV